MRARALGAAACVLAVGCAHGPRPPAAQVPPAEPSGEAAAACARMDAVAISAAPPSELARGRALYCLKLYAASLSALAGRALGPAAIDREIENAVASAEAQAPARLADPATLRWLVVLARRFPDWDGVGDAIGPVVRSDLERPELADVHDELCDLAGRYYYKQGRYKEAIALSRLISAANPLHVKAALREGAAHVHEYQVRPAVEAFKEALRAASASADPNVAGLHELATISLARTFYSTGQYDLAAKYYDLLPPSSRYRAEATFEAAWTSFMANDHPRALSFIRALAAVPGDVKPESTAEAEMLEAEIALSDGHPDAATSALDRFNAVYPRLFEQMKQVIADNPDDDGMFALATKVRAGSSGLSPAVEHAARVVLSDRALARRFERLDELSREVALLATLDPVWLRAPIGQAVSFELVARRSEAVKEAGDLFRRRLNRLTQELAQLIKRSLGIQYEPLQAARGTM